jgi:hypothetical protein
MNFNGFSNKRIPQLSSATQLQGGEYVAVYQDNALKKVTISQIFDTNSWVHPEVITANAGTSNSEYSLPGSGEEIVWKGGAIQVRGIDYTRTGNDIAFIEGNIPAEGEEVTVVVSTGSSSWVHPEVITANAGTSNSEYSLPGSGEEIVWKGGAIQVRGIDYTRTGNDITFIEGNIPAEGEEVTVVVSRNIFSNLNTLEQCFVVSLSDETTNITTGIKVTMLAPFAMTLKNIRGGLTQASSNGNVVVDLHQGGTTVMSTNKITIEATKTDSEDSATQPIITTTSVLSGDKLEFEIDSAGTGAKGLKIYLYYVRT